MPKVVVDVTATGAANVGTDNVEEDDVESTLGALPPKANVPSGTAGLVPVAGLPNENFGVVVTVEKPTNVTVLAVDLAVSSSLAAPNTAVGVDATAAIGSAAGFEPNENLPLGTPKSMPPLPNANFGVDVGAPLDEVAAVVSLSLAC